MKYSIRGRLNMGDGASVVTLLNDYELWRLETRKFIDRNEREIFSFEVWLNTVEEKDSLFESLKTYVDEFGEVIDWHLCSHDELNRTPCVIVETYVRSG